MNIRTSKIAGTTLALAAALALVATPVFARNAGYSASTSPVQSASAQSTYPGLNVSGTATFTVSGNILTANIVASGLTPGLPHLMHIHGVVGMQNDCPGASVADDRVDDGLIDTVEGLPSYGPIDVTFSTSGSTTPGAALSLATAPVASETGTLTYSRTFRIPGKIAAHLSDLHVVIHGADLDGSGGYDGVDGSLGAGIPLEAEIPVSCGAIN
ncbi:MAG TPA: hypothetical protein VM451_08430 [Candidatus Limnocylindria bacterium]|nr:hypothetical protein [Candidatus Limnocylindria bacterium]